MPIHPASLMPQSKPRLQLDYDVLISFIIIGSLITASLLSQVAALIFLLSGVLHVCLRFPYALAAMRVCWPLMLFATVGVLSTLWSDTPILTLKRSIQLMATTIICITLLYTVKKETIVSVMMISLAILMLYALSSSRTVTIAYTGEVVRIGHFGSKNAMSSFASFTAMVGIATWLLPSIPKPIKWLGAISMLLSMLTFYHAKSLGTNLSFFAILALALCLYFYTNRPISIINRRIFNIVFAFYFVLFVCLAIYFFDFKAYEELMYSIGKDPTITGRTIIWEIGSRSIMENPILGVGLHGYWNEDNLGAIEIWEALHKEIGAAFGFHNLYIHYYVELGVLGLTAILAIIHTSLKSIHHISSTKMEPFDIFVFCIFIFFLVKSFFETVGFTQFSLGHFKLCLFWIYLNRKTYADCGKKILITHETKL